MNKIVKDKADQALKFIDKFRAFAMRGNVIDMAVGVIIGAAFGKIVNSLVKDILMPPLGLLIGGIDFAHYKITLKQALYSPTGKLIQEAVTLNVGAFFQVIFDFVIVAFSLFVVIQLVTRTYQKFEQQKEKDVQKQERKQNRQEVLLKDIRDILKSQSKSKK